MSVNAITPSSSSQQTNELDTIAKDLKSLQKALSSGNLASAQSAFTQFKKDLQGPNASSTAPQTSPNGTQDTLQKDLQGLQDALKAGDLNGARNAFTQFTSDLKNLFGEGGSKANSGSQNNSVSYSSVSITEINVTAFSGSNVNVTA